MSIEHGVMRTALVANLLGALARNRKHQLGDVRLFEIGPVFLRRAAGELTRSIARNAKASISANVRSETDCAKRRSSAARSVMRSSSRATSIFGPTCSTARRSPSRPAA